MSKVLSNALTQHMIKTSLFILWFEKNELNSNTVFLVRGICVKNANDHFNTSLKDIILGFFLLMVDRLKDLSPAASITLNRAKARAKSHR